MAVLLSVRELTKSFGPQPLFSGLCLDLQAGEKVGLIGPNGAGKSTLLKILAGIEPPDAGARVVGRGVRIGYVPQDDVFPVGRTVREIVLDGFATDDLEEHERETRAAIALTQAGFADHDVLADTLSGGWRKRLAVAREFARRPDVLLLDEPTNHLDLPGVVWLERVLRAAPFACLAVTHDRAFLRAVADDVVEVSRVYPDGVFRSAGGYDVFADRRDDFLDAQERQREAVANQVRRETEWLSRKESAQRRKSKSRIEAAADRRTELADLAMRTAATGAAGIDFVGTGRQSRKLLVAAGIAKSLGGRPLFDGVDLVLSPGTRLGLLGPNGSGKSTLLRVLAGELPPDAGTVTRAEGLRVAVFEQGRASLDPATRLRRALAPGGDTIVYRGQPMHVAGWAKRFLFRPDQLDLELSALSGGERARVRIAQLMLQPADLLLLDEPTNDLDIPALEVLEESLADFPGALVLVTHDREMMDRLCTTVVGLDGRGAAAAYGSVGQWLAAYERATTQAAPAPPKSPPKPAPQVSQPKKLTWKERQEWEGMETAIHEAEESMTKRQAEVQAAATAGHAALAEACLALDAARQTVDRLYERWQELEAKRGP
jgi:ABC transport system ATP-binding/permease protein